VIGALAVALAMGCDLIAVLFRSRAAVIAENLFLRRQLALYLERKTGRRRPTPATKFALVILSRFFPWAGAVAIVKPDTFVRWHRTGFRLFWRWKSRHAGRPPLPKNLRSLITAMAQENPSWGEGRIADELFLKLGLFVDSRTVGKYLKQGGRPRQPTGQRWATFIHNHASAIVACDFFTSVTATFQVLYVFVAIEIGSRRILHCNVTNHPTAEWTRQQFREFLDGESSHRYLIHDRDSVFSVEVDAAVKGFGLRVLKTPVRSPMANAYCERVIGSIRRECLDYLIPLTERHLKRILREYVRHYNRGRPHSALGPGFPEPTQATVPASGHRHRLPPGLCVAQTPVLGGLHHEYRLEKEVA
jgi:transposase InsO family protein